MGQRARQLVDRVLETSMETGLLDLTFENVRNMISQEQFDEVSDQANRYLSDSSFKIIRRQSPDVLESDYYQDLVTLLAGKHKDRYSGRVLNDENVLDMGLEVHEVIDTDSEISGHLKVMFVGTDRDDFVVIQETLMRALFTVVY